MSDVADEHVLTYETALGAPERDVDVSRLAWEHSEGQLRGVRPAMLRLAREHRASLHVNEGGRYPEPALVIQREHDGLSTRLKLSAEPFAAEPSMLAGYRLGILASGREPV